MVGNTEKIMKKKAGVVDKAKEYYLERGEYVVPARKAKRIRREISRKTRR